MFIDAHALGSLWWEAVSDLARNNYSYKTEKMNATVPLYNFIPEVAFSV
jgi:hypothetical protein